MLKRIKTTEQLKNVFKTMYEHGVFGEASMVDAVLKKFEREFNGLDEPSKRAHILHEEVRKYKDAFNRNSEKMDERRLREFDERGLDLLDSVSLPQYMECLVLLSTDDHVGKFFSFYSEEDIAEFDMERFVRFLES